MKALFAAALVVSSFAAMPAMAGPPLRITFQNGSTAPIVRLFIRTAGSRAWGPNQAMGGIPAGGRVQVMLADGADKCVADLRLRSRTGVVFGGRVNFCQSHSFTYHGRS